MVIIYKVSLTILEYAMSEIPGIGFGIVFSPVTWNFSAEPEKHCCGDFIDNVRLQYLNPILFSSH